MIDFVSNMQTYHYAIVLLNNREKCQQGALLSDARLWNHKQTHCSSTLSADNLIHQDMYRIWRRKKNLDLKQNLTKLIMHNSSKRPLTLFNQIMVYEYFSTIANRLEQYHSGP